MPNPNTDVPTGYFQYETKCRRCLNLNSWAGLSYAPEHKAEKYRSFAEQMREKIQYPRQAWCEHCQKSTVQDVVSYETYSEA